MIRPRFRIDNLSGWLLLASALGYFLTVASLFLDKPGLETNEAFPGNDYLEILQGPKRGLEYSLMTHYYEGTTVALLLIPLSAIFGFSVFLLRFIHIVFSIGSLLSIHFVTSRLFSPRIAIWTTLLMAFSPVFIRCTRIGNCRDEILMIFLFWFGLALATLAHETKKARWLYAAGFVMGIGLWTKIMFLGYLVGLGGALLVLGRRGLFPLRDRLFSTRIRVVGFAVSFLIGSLPFWTYNVLTNGKTFTSLWKNLWTPTYQRNNLDLLGNLGHRLANLWSIITQAISTDSAATTGTNYVATVFFLISLGLVLGYLCFGKRAIVDKRMTLGCLAGYTILFVLTSFTPGPREPLHLAILFPAFQLIAAIAVSITTGACDGFRVVRRILPCLLIVPLLVSDAHGTVKYLSSISRGEISGYYDVVIYDIAKFLSRDEPDDEPVTVFALSEYRIEVNVDVITRKRVRVRELVEFYPYNWRALEGTVEHKVQAIYEDEMAKEPDVILAVLTGGQYHDFSTTGFRGFQKYLEGKGKRLVPQRTFKYHFEDVSLTIYEVTAVTSPPNGADRPRPASRSDTRPLPP